MLFGHSKKKKTKKELQLEKNKRNQLLQQLSDMSRGIMPDEGLGMPEYVRPKEKPKRAEADQTETAWSAKVQEIKNRNDNSRRLAKDRFNRMAGTGEAGGRGR